MTTRTLVVCIGNDLVGDDGVGHEIFRQLSKRALPSGVRVCLLGLGGIDIIDHLDGEEVLIVVDAVQLGQPAGTVRVLPWEDIPASDLRPVSGHGIGIREALQVCRRLYPDKAAQNVYLVGVEGSCFNELGTGLTDVVRRAVPEAVGRVVELIDSGPVDQPADR